MLWKHVVEKKLLLQALDLEFMNQCFNCRMKPVVWLRLTLTPLDHFYIFSNINNFPKMIWSSICEDTVDIICRYIVDGCVDIYVFCGRNITIYLILNTTICTQLLLPELEVESILFHNFVQYLQLWGLSEINCPKLSEK